MWILLNTVVAALIQIVNARTLRSFPLLSTTAANTGMAVAWLLLGAAATAPRGAWGGDASMVAAGELAPSRLASPRLRLD